MSGARKDGGPAFPLHPDQSLSPSLGRSGMTLRDYFAAKAMQALVASGDEGAGDRIDDIPEYAYLIADAMLRAREAS